MENSKTKKKNTPRMFCKECGTEMKFYLLNISRFIKEKQEVHKYTFKCPKCGRKSSIKLIKKHK